MSLIEDTLWAKYISEREGFTVLERENCFVIYKIRDNECFISHMYVEPIARSSGFGKGLIKELKEIALNNDCNAIVGTVDLRVGDPSNTLLASIKAGFNVYGANGDIILIAMKLNGGV